MTIYRYYSKLRPVSIGTYPKTGVQKIIDREIVRETENAKRRA